MNCRLSARKGVGKQAGGRRNKFNISNCGYLKTRRVSFPIPSTPSVLPVYPCLISPASPRLGLFHHLCFVSAKGGVLPSDGERRSWPYSHCDIFSSHRDSSGKKVNASGTPWGIIRQFYTGEEEQEMAAGSLKHTHAHTVESSSPCSPLLSYGHLFYLLIALMVLPASRVFLLARGSTLALHPSSLGLH